MKPDPQYDAMSVEDLPCTRHCNKESEWGDRAKQPDWHSVSCPARHRAKYAARLQAVATASHKAGAEAMREKAHQIATSSLYGWQAAERIRALALPTGERG